MKVFVGADHRGFKLKEEIKRWLQERGGQVVDTGAEVYEEDDDYPIIAEALGKAVVEKDGLGVLLCGSGVGASAAVNKIDGVRAAIGVSPDQVKAGRHDDDMNVLVLAADEIETEEAKRLVEIFLATKYGEAKRYERRLKEIQQMEETN